MKRYILMLVAVLALGFSGCNDDLFLEEHPDTFYTAQDAFKTVDQVKACVTNMYVHARYWLQNDVFLKGKGTDFYDDPMWRSSGNGISNFSSWSSDKGEINNIYDAFYQLVSYANQTLEGAEVSGLNWDSEDDRLYVRAQARFFRGFAYLVLGELYGGVPLVETFYQEPRYDFTRSTREETYRFAIADLKAAADTLPDYPKEAGYVAKGAAFHFLAEAYIALATIRDNDVVLLDSAVKATEEVTARHALMKERFGSRANPDGGEEMNGVAAYYPDGDVFFDLFQRGNLDYSEGNTEALWTLQNDVEVWHEFGGNQSLAYPNNFSPVMREMKWTDEYVTDESTGPWVANIDEIKYPGGNFCAYVGGRGVSFNAPTKYVCEDIWENDEGDIRNSAVNIRREWVCIDTTHPLYGKPVTLDMLKTDNIDRFYPIWTKFAPVDDWGFEDLQYGGNRSNMFRDDYACRLAETWLLQAEAYLRMGNTGKAADAVNEVRSRAKCQHLATAGEMSLQYILDERARELFLEERRWCTLLRMGHEVFADQLLGYAYYTRDYPTYTGTLEWSLFPIPQKAIDSNLDAKLEQNEGW